MFKYIWLYDKPSLTWIGLWLTALEKWKRVLVIKKEKKKVKAAKSPPARPSVQDQVSMMECPLSQRKYVCLVFHHPLEAREGK